MLFLAISYLPNSILGPIFGPFLGPISRALAKNASAGSASLTHFALAKPER